MTPPPPSTRWLARLVHRAQAPDQQFRVRAEIEDRGSSGLFLGTYSPLPYAAPCGWSPRTRPLTSGSAIASPVEVVLQRAALGLPYADVLLTFASLDLDFASENGRQVEGSGGVDGRCGRAGWPLLRGTPNDKLGGGCVIVVEFASRR